MRTLNEIKQILKANKKELFDRYGIAELAIFGSYTRNEENINSDIDILVEFNKPIGVEFIDLAEELENLLNQHIDLVSKNGIKSSYLNHIQKDLSYV